jgi:hypothetical protein
MGNLERGDDSEPAGPATSAATTRRPSPVPLHVAGPLVRWLRTFARLVVTSRCSASQTICYAVVDGHRTRKCACPR